MKNLLLVFIGGGLGSTLRYIISKHLSSTASGIPWGTFTVNILGSFIIGLILGLAAKNSTFSHSQTLILATGFCGGFTTFSTFAYENHMFLKSGDFFSFALYTLMSFVTGFIMVFLAMYLIKQF